MTRFFALIAGFSVLVLFGCKNNERVNPPGLEDDDTGDDDIAADDIADDDFCGPYQGQTSNHALARIPRGSDSIRPDCLAKGTAKK